MKKPRLMTPGPAPVPEDVLLEMARPIIHHRSAEAKQVITDCAAGLKYTFQTQNDVLILTASGTGALEAALVNTVARGQKVIVLNAGWFAQRWQKIAQAYGIEVVSLDFEWGQAVEPAQLEAALKQLDRLPQTGADTLAGWRTQASRRIEIDRRVADIRAAAVRDLAANGAAAPDLTLKRGVNP